MAVTTVEEPMLSRLDRLDTIVRQLEELRGGNSCRTPKSSCPSTPSSCTQASSLDFSPRSLEKHCRPIDDVMEEMEMKGTLIERLVHVEDRVAKLCMQLEEERDAEKRRIEVEEKRKIEVEKKVSKKKNGLKQLVKSCVTGGNGSTI